MHIVYLSPRVTGSLSDIIPKVARKKGASGPMAGPTLPRVMSAVPDQTPGLLMSAAMTSPWMCFLQDRTRSRNSHIILNSHSIAGHWLNDDTSENDFLKIAASFC